MISSRPPLAPRLVPLQVPDETVVSYAARIEELLESPKGLLTNKARSELRAQGHKSFTVKQLIGQLATLLEELCQLPHNTFDRTPWGTGLAWHSCPACGPIAQVVPSVSRYVCQEHLRWTGPTAPEQPDRWAPQLPTTNHGAPVEPRVATAVLEIMDLKAAAPRLADECISRALSVHMRLFLSEIRPEDLVVAACLATTIQSTDTLTRVAHAQNAEAGYDAVLRSMMHTMLADDLDWDDDMVAAVADQAWMALRPTAVQARIISGRQRPLMDFTPYIDVPSHLSGAPWGGEPTEWLTATRTSGRTDEKWWNDQYALEGPGNWVLMCPAGHVLHEHPAHARRSGYEHYRCVICAGSRAVPGFTSLADTDPDIAAQWHPTLNGKASPEHYVRGSNVKVWWLCPAGHSYDIAIESRTLKGSGCHQCSLPALVKGHNDLATTHPHLAAMWDPTADNPPAESVSARTSTVEITLRCPKGHGFVLTSKRLVAAANPCQECSGRVLISGVNDLATLYPLVATWWHPTRNGNLKPQDVAAKSRQFVWWRCPDNHPFRARIENRTKKQEPTCPVDTGRLLWPGTNDLATKHPDLVRDWDYQRNALSPQETVPGRGRRWWTCSAGHTQHAYTTNRIRSGGCTLCPPEDRVAEPVTLFNRGRQGWDKRARQ